jgi:hypothetical protein
VTLRIALGLSLVAVLAGCGASGSGPSPAGVVRAWTNAVGVDDNEAAANFFAPNAEVLEPGADFRLATHADAVIWNAGRSCAGRIVSLTTQGNEVRTVLELRNRRSSVCPVPGRRERAVLEIDGGKITELHELGAPALQPPGAS